MARALAITLCADSRTSFGEPVLPEVDSSNARSGCRRRADPGSAELISRMPSPSMTMSGAYVAVISGYGRPAGIGSTTCPAASAPR